MRIIRMLIMGGLLSLAASSTQAQSVIYQNSFSDPESVKDWIMEGPGEVEFSDGWMQMYSPNEAYHHVFWCPENFPDSIIVEWEAQNMERDAGLCTIYFAAQGVNGEDIFDPSFPERDGTAKDYTRGPLNSYHISYYANTPKKPDRENSHLRKNNQFVLVQKGDKGIPANSNAIHKIRLLKMGPHIQMYIDDRRIIDWIDNGVDDPRPYYKEGSIGLRQMQWTHFRYRNFKVWSQN